MSPGVMSVPCRFYGVVFFNCWWQHHHRIFPIYVWINQAFKVILPLNKFTLCLRNRITLNSFKGPVTGAFFFVFLWEFYKTFFCHYCWLRFYMYSNFIPRLLVAVVGTISLGVFIFSLILRWNFHDQGFPRAFAPRQGRGSRLQSPLSIKPDSASCHWCPIEVPPTMVFLRFLTRGTCQHAGGPCWVHIRGPLSSSTCFYDHRVGVSWFLLWNSSD